MRELIRLIFHPCSLFASSAFNVKFITFWLNMYNYSDEDSDFTRWVLTLETLETVIARYRWNFNYSLNANEGTMFDNGAISWSSVKCTQVTRRTSRVPLSFVIMNTVEVQLWFHRVLVSSREIRFAKSNVTWFTWLAFLVKSLELVNW